MSEDIANPPRGDEQSLSTPSNTPRLSAEPVEREAARVEHDRSPTASKTPGHPQANTNNQQTMLISVLTVIVGLMVIVGGLAYFKGWILLAGSNGLTQPSATAQSTSPSTDEVAYQKYLQSESIAAYTDHESVLLWIAYCRGEPTIDKLPKEITAILKPPDYYTYFTGTEGQTNIQKLEPEMASLNWLSKTIYRQRETTATSLQELTEISRKFQTAIIVIGFLTTIFAGISATNFGRGDSRIGGLIRVLTIILPALGTAAVASGALYAPRDDVTRASRALSLLAQLHRDLGSTMWDVGCPIGDDSKKTIQADVVKWKGQLSNILSTSDSSTQSSGTGGGTAGAAPGAPPGSASPSPRL